MALGNQSLLVIQRGALKESSVAFLLPPLQLIEITCDVFVWHLRRLRLAF